MSSSPSEPPAGGLGAEFAASALFQEYTRHSTRRGGRRPSTLVSLQRRWFVGKITTAGALSTYSSELRAGNLSSDDAFGRCGQLVGTAVLLDLAQRGSPFVSADSSEAHDGYVRLTLRMVANGHASNTEQMETEFFLHGGVVSACVGFASRLCERQRAQAQALRRLPSSSSSSDFAAAPAAEDINAADTFPPSFSYPIANPSSSGTNTGGAKSPSSRRRKSAAWTAHEDSTLRDLVAKHGPRWKTISEQMDKLAPGHKGKQATQCRDRWNE